MNSLSAHLTAGPRHGRLGFHPGCPICERQRLLGPSPVLTLSPRAQAGLLLGAVAAGALLPSTSAAANTTAWHPGAHASQAPPGLPEDGQPGADGSAQEQSGTDETAEPPTDEAPDLRDVLTSPDAGSDVDGEDVGAEDLDTPPPAAEPPADPALPTPPAPSPTVAPAPAAPAPVADVPVGTPDPPETASAGALVDRLTGAPMQHRPHRIYARQGPRHAAPRTAVSREVEVPSSTAVEPVAVTPPAVQVPVARVSAGTERIAGSVYRVRAGDSLWSIARCLLGTSASNGRVATAVARLWRLNRERIGTGDPDLLRVGTELRVR